MNKKWTLILLCACALAVMTACSTNADVLPSPSPSLMPSPSAAVTMPIATGTPLASASPMATEGGAMTIEEARTVSEKVEDEVGKLSEVDEATAVVAGKMAVVGVTFDSQYKGGLSTRFTQMVQDRIQTVKTGITEVGVTDDPELIKEIDNLKKTMKDTNTTLETLETKVSELMGKINSKTNPTTTP